MVALKVKKSSKPTPPPTTSPSAVPSPTQPPTDQPTYLYIGKYTLSKNKQTGCAIVITTQSGKPFTGSKYAGLAVGTPLIKYPKHFKTTVVDQGPVSVKLTKLSSKGGSGKATLLLKNGGTFDTATVTLTSRFAEP